MGCLWPQPGKTVARLRKEANGLHSNANERDPVGGNPVRVRGNLAGSEPRLKGLPESRERLDHPILRCSAIDAARKGGQAAMLLLVTMSIVAFGALGFAIDAAQMYAQRQMAQTAADAAAQAAMMSILDGTYASSTHPFPATAFTCAVPPAVLDLRTPCVYAQDNGFGTSADTVNVSMPLWVPGVALASVTVPAVSVSVQRTVATGLVRFVGAPSTYSIKAESTASITASAATTCLYALSPGGIDFGDSASGNITANCGIYDNGSFSHSGSGNINVSQIRYVGTYSNTGSGSVSPVPGKVAGLAVDPFAGLPPITVPTSCDQTNFSISDANSHAISPGVYCGGLSISGSGNVTFAAGVYIINGGSSFAYSGSGNLTGANVTFFITGTHGYTAAPISVSGSGNLTFSAASSGIYQGILFFQDPSVTYAGTNSFGGSGNVTGTLYFPTTTLSYSGSGNAASYQGIVASKISFTGSGNINILKDDATGSHTGLVTKSATLTY
jgi:hypothetical protein